MNGSEAPPQRQMLRFFKAFFEVFDIDATRDRLLSAGALELVGPSSERAVSSHDLWYRWHPPGPAKRGDNLGLAVLIRITRRRLVLEGPNASAVGTAWRELDALLRPHARARVAAGDDLARFLPRQRRHSADRPESWNRDHQEQVLREFYAAFCGRWARQPHPQLDGKTPVEAATDPVLQVRLEQLLCRMERIEEQRQARRLQGISVAELRETVYAHMSEER